MSSNSDIRIVSPGAAVTATPVSSSGDIQFGTPDLVTACTSEYLRPRSTIRIGGMSASLGVVAATGSVLIRLLKNGVEVAQMTIPTGQQYAYTTFTPIVFVGRVDALAVQTSIGYGTGAAGLGGLLETA